MKWPKSLWESLTTPVAPPEPPPAPIAKPIPVQSPVQSQSSFNEPIGNFTPHAQQSLALARKEADRLRHNFVGTEHLLLGVIRLGQGTAVRVLQKMGLNLDTLRLAIENQVGIGPDPKTVQNVTLTPRTRKVLAQNSPIDTARRYDIYCLGQDREVVVICNALFKARRSLFKEHQFDTPAEFFEIEQFDGQIVFVSRHSVVKFCEHVPTLP